MPQFKIGDRVHDRDGNEAIVTEVRDDGSISAKMGNKFFTTAGPARHYELVAPAPVAPPDAIAQLARIIHLEARLTRLDSALLANRLLSMGDYDEISQGMDRIRAELAPLLAEFGIVEDTK